MAITNMQLPHVPALVFTSPALPLPQAWLEGALQAEDASLGAWMQEPGEEAKAVISHIHLHSPYLTHLLALFPGVLRACCEEGPDAAEETLFSALTHDAAAAADTETIMCVLRQAKGRIALLAACADIAGYWPLARVTECLSRLADNAASLALAFLLGQAQRRGEIALPCPDAPEQGCGIIVLGMGKLGAFELNYSSDIDLIIFYEKGVLSYRGRQTEQHFMNKLCHDLVHILQERTGGGYVFRTDLRLRPDPASTPPAVNVDAALSYYESVGQNWERAAMIKARPIAGDKAAGEEFLRQLSPFLWRRHLDFAAINDIHSIKRQMDHRLGAVISVPGHNVKLGLGGIREIEFSVQVQQLIWGGREPGLRLRGTCETLARLEELGKLEPEKQETLSQAYVYLRTLEHRLQMVDDQQTHSLPETVEGLSAIASFMNYPDADAFKADVSRVLHAVHDIFASSYRSSATLGDEGNLVFTGASHDPATLATLSRLGFQKPEVISEAVMGWHHGSRRCTRTKRARELLTELMPVLLKRLSETASPDDAFLKFDEFLRFLPAGVQLFSLFTNNPGLLSLVAAIMGSAPVLAESLSRHPDLIEAVLLAGFYDPLPGRAELDSQLDAMLAVAEHMEEKLDMLRRFKNEKQFQAGVQLLRGMVNADESGPFLARLADTVLARAILITSEEFARDYGRIEGARFAVVALGRAGSEEMTFGSDLDLVFIYDVPDFERLSDGPKPYTASVYYNRFCQRLLSALTSLSREGRLYDVDTRLRPSGKQGLLAVSISAVSHYFDELAWTFERMALTRARPAAGDASLCKELEALFASILCGKRDIAKLAEDVRDMRRRVAAEFPADQPWNLKYARGGLLDLDFIAQYLLLAHAHAHPTLLRRSAREILQAAEAEGLIAREYALPERHRFLTRLFNLMRLSTPKGFEPHSASPGLAQLLASGMDEPDLAALEKNLLAVESGVADAYSAILS